MFNLSSRKVLAGVLMLAASAVYAKEPRMAADLPIPLPSGQKIRLPQYTGKVVLLVIFSTECKDCIAAMDMLGRVQKEYAARGLQVIGAAGDDNAQYLVEPFVQRYKVKFPVGYLGKDEMIKIADIPKDKKPTAPIFIFIDKKNVVRFEYYGDDPFFRTADGTTHSIIDNLLMGK
jgi:thiol-disulfide isomerase/thioredoxin